MSDDMPGLKEAIGAGIEAGFIATGGLEISRERLRFCNEAATRAAYPIIAAAVREQAFKEGYDEGYEIGRECGEELWSEE